MKVDELKIYKNKKIKIFLKNKYAYTCVIERFNDESITVIDKFNKHLTISVEDISYVEEMGDDE